MLQLHASVALIAHLATLQRGRQAGARDARSTARAAQLHACAPETLSTQHADELQPTHRSSPPQVYRFVEREALRATL